MGGKKKTKWRKLPLEEFTKEIPTKPDKVPQEDTCQADLTSEEISYIPSYNETVGIAQQYVEPYEYSDGLWYPTSCVVYNPAEVGLYSNYMMPVDTCYYYYTMPDMQPMQDYVTVPYQDFSQLPKDTVYLLLPPQTVRPSQPVPSITPEWPNRRRRRRYEGYADYAVIPDKTPSNKAEEKDRSKRNGQYVNSRRNSNQSSNYKRMTSFSEPNNFDSSNSVSEQNQSSSKPSEMKKNSIPSVNMNNGQNQSLINEMNGTDNIQKPKKNLEICGIHSKTAVSQKEPQTVTENSGSPSLILKNEVDPDMDFNSTDIVNTQNTFSDNLVNISDSSQICDYENNLLNESLSLENEKTNINKPEEQRHKIEDVNVPLKGIPENIPPLQNINQEINSNTQASTFVQEIPEEFSLDKELLNTSTEDIPETNSQSSLPDILSTLNKSVANEKVRDSELSRSRPDSADLDKGLSFKSKSLLSQTSYLPNLLSSEALHNEMELELKQLNSLHSLQANQSIYKLAYDENVTDQSEADSRSPSPMDPESHVPTSLTSAEILIHEADSGSEAGSEDVELIPHRYESETFLNENKHVYINRLSLAVELLRTQESLPYDDEFKRVVGENNILPGVHSGGKVNLGFVEDSCSPPPFTISSHYKNNNTSLNNKTEVVSQYQLKHSANSSSDSAIFSDIGFDNLDDELCEPAKEVAAQSSESQDNTEEIRAGYRRFGVQARHYLSPRAALPLNPCFCCIVM